MRNKLLASMAGILFLSGQAYALDCSNLELIQKEFDFWFRAPIQHRQPNQQTPPLPSYRIYETKPIKLPSNLTLCEVVFSFDIKGEGIQPKSIVYIGEDMMIMGEIRVREGGGVRMLTAERMSEVNREFLEEMRRRHEREMKEGEERRRAEVEAIKRKVGEIDFSKYGDVVLGRGDREFVVFVDVMCPFCKRVIEFLSEELKSGKDFRVRYVLVGVLSDTSRERAVGVICNYRGAEERVRAILGKVEAGKGCEEGVRKVRGNNELFSRIGAGGVPLIVVYERGKVVDVVLGADMERLRRYVEGGVK